MTDQTTPATDTPSTPVRLVDLMRLLAWPLFVFTLGLLAMGGYMLQLGGFVG